VLVWLGSALDGPAVGHLRSRQAGHGAPTALSPIGPRESFSTVWTGYELIVFGRSRGDRLAIAARGRL
jgi:hypothetical protein